MTGKLKETVEKIDPTKPLPQDSGPKTPPPPPPPGPPELPDSPA